MVETNSLQQTNGHRPQEDKQEGDFRNTKLPPQFPPPYDGQLPPGVLRSDFLDSLCTSVNQDLLISKTFYFFFFSAFGSLFPLMGIFFKQLGMNPVQCGILVGFRPFVEFLSAPFWGTIADQYRKGKAILLFSLFCWIVFTLSLSFVQTPAASCIIYNSTHHILVRPENIHLIGKRSIENDSIENVAENDEYWPSINARAKRNRRKEHLPPGHVIGQSPHTPYYAVNFDPAKHGSFVKPVFSTVVYKREEVQKTFFLILLLVVIGEFFSAPAITLADSVTLTYLGENANNYGRQRMFGSLGWGVAMFFVGIALDQSTAFPDHPCQPDDSERNYTICFAVFSVLMGCAFITATQFRFDYDIMDDDIAMKPMPQPHDDYLQEMQQRQQELRQQQQQQQQQQLQYNPFQNEDVTNPYGPTTVAVNDESEMPPPANPENVEPKPEKSKVFASTTKRIPEWIRVLRTFANLRYGAFLFVAWWMGFGIGLVFTFLFWHLQDLGGSPTLFGVASVINHISEIFAYFFSFRLIKRIGHVKVLCLGLCGNLARFLYISWLSDPWWVLPFEFIQGMTHAAVWAACCSYITQATPITLRTSAQGVLQGLHHGLGRGCGAVLGGLVATYAGTAVTFRIYGFACVIILLSFIFINFYRAEEGGFTTTSEEPRQVLEDNFHLDPHGVPSSPMPRVLSSSRLEHLNGGNYGSLDPHTSGGFLDIPKMGGGAPTGEQGNWTQIGSSMYTGNREEIDSTRSNHKSLAEAFQLKTSPVSSPQAAFDYDYIRKDFKAYNDVVYAFNAKDDINDSGQPLKAPAPMMMIHAQQPEVRSRQVEYDW